MHSFEDIRRVGVTLEGVGCIDVPQTYDQRCECNELTTKFKALALLSLEELESNQLCALYTYPKPPVTKPVFALGHSIIRHGVLIQSIREKDDRFS